MRPERGSASAQNRLGVMYPDGVGVARDDEASTAWFRMAAAEQGYALAQTELRVPTVLRESICAAANSSCRQRRPGRHARPQSRQARGSLALSSPPPDPLPGLTAALRGLTCDFLSDH